MLSLPASRRLSRERRVALEAKSLACRLARGEAQAAVAQAREILRDMPSSIDGVRVRVMIDLARAEFDLGRIQEAGTSAAAALELAERIGDRARSGSALMLLGNTAYRSGDLAIARDYHEQALGIFRRLGDEPRAALARNNIGLIHKQLCEWDSAAQCFEAVLDNSCMSVVITDSEGWIEYANRCFREATNFEEASDRRARFWDCLDSSK